MEYHYLLPHVDDMVCAHLLDIIDLLRLKRKGVHLRPHGLSPEDGVMSQPANADHTDLLARTAAVRLEWGINGEAST